MFVPNDSSTNIGARKILCIISSKDFNSTGWEYEHEQ